MNEMITYDVLQAALDAGVLEFIVCAGSRNTSFVEALRNEPLVKTYYHPEERSASFFALGRARRDKRPVAIITTSGTAVGELLPAVMEACHTNVPLLLITADRPKIFRGSGAPQSCNQPNIFGSYVSYFQDIDTEDQCSLASWDLKSPAHLNICLEEPKRQPKFVGRKLILKEFQQSVITYNLDKSQEILNEFLDEVERPFVIVSTLTDEAREPTVNFLLSLGAPVMLEGISGIREDIRLSGLRISSTDKIFETSELCNYKIDGILRIGGVPTHRIWRDIEYKQEDLKVCNITEVPLSGLSFTRSFILAPIHHFLSCCRVKSSSTSSSELWRELDLQLSSKLLELMEEEPLAEVSFIHYLSKQQEKNSFIYLGNSLPIREWDFAATHEYNGFNVQASRGLNGIDGQLSTFFGLCKKGRSNVAFFGDLTTLYDLAGPWILSQLGDLNLTIIVINNGGGKIFEKLFPYPEMLNSHNISFDSFAKMWGLAYMRIDSPTQLNKMPLGFNLIELRPNQEATIRFSSKQSKIELELTSSLLNVLK